jgi:hypothetical protein
MELHTILYGGHFTVRSIKEKKMITNDAEWGMDAVGDRGQCREVPGTEGEVRPGTNDQRLMG